MTENFKRLINVLHLAHILLSCDLIKYASFLRGMDFIEHKPIFSMVKNVPRVIFTLENYTLASLGKVSEAFRTDYEISKNIG